MKNSIKLAIFTFICLLGLIKSGNLIPDTQNPVMFNQPNINNSPSIDVRFSFDTNSAGYAYYQYMVLVFPPNVITDLQFDQGSTIKYSCGLTDGTTTYTMTAEKPLTAAEGNFAYCKLTDLTNSLIKAGTKMKFTLTLIGTKFSSNFVRSLKFFTATSNKVSKVIIDQLSFVGNVALYADPYVYANKAIDITSSAILMGSSTVTNIYPYQTFDISLNIKSNIFISAADIVFTFKFNKNVVTPAQSAISNSLNLGTSTDPLSAAIKGSLTLSTVSTGDTIILSGITEDLIPNRQFQIVLKSWKALDKVTNTLSPLEMMVYYKNTYSLISYVNASTNFFKISYSTITLTAGHPDGWDIFRNGVFPMRFTYTSAVDLTNGGFVLIQQSNTVDLISRFNFVAATCDFSENDNNFDQAFGKRPQCFPIRTDFSYSGSPSTGYNGSGIFFYVKSLQANKTYYVTVWGSADACGGTSGASNFASAINQASTNTQFNFQLTVYNGINVNNVNENRFTNIPILGQSVAQTMSNKCWNNMSQLLTNFASTYAQSDNPPATIPFYETLYIGQVKLNDSGAAACAPTTGPNYLCKLSNDINLYKEFYNIKLINHTTAYTAGLYFVDLTAVSPTNKTENFIYGSNVISTNSYFALTFEFPVMPSTKIFEYIPSPIAYDLATAGGTGPANGVFMRATPGRLEFKVSKNWFAAGDAATSTSPGCYFSWGIDQALGTTNAVKPMKNIPTPSAASDCGLVGGAPNFISSYVNTGGTGCTANDIAMLDRDNSILPVANTANSYTHYKIISLWNATGAGATGLAPGSTSGSGYTGGNNNFNFPAPLSGMNTKFTATSLKLTVALFTSCLKWNPPTTIKSLYTSIDIQLNYLYATDAATIANAAPHRAIRLIKLFPEGGVFQDIAGTATRLISGANLPDTTVATSRSYKLHYSTGSQNTNIGVCLIEIYGTGLGNTSDSSSAVLAIWIGFGVILEQDYNDLSSNYPVAPLANASYNTYGLQSGYFMNTKENFLVHNYFGAFEKDGFVDTVASGYNNLNQLPLRYLLMKYAYSGATTNTGNFANPWIAAGTAHTEQSMGQLGRSNYIFLMGSLVLITGITSNSITTNSNVNNLYIPIYCPVHDSGSLTGAIKHYNGLPTLYMAYLTMSGFNSISSVNRIYSHKVNANGDVYSIISPVAQSSTNYYKTTFVNTSLFHNSTTYLNYLITLRWATYTSTITNNDNILYMYYGNASGTFTADANANCTGHIWLVKSSLVTIDTSNLTKSGFSNVTDPALFNGTKKFYYLGNEFNKAIMMGLGTANPTAVQTATGAFSAQALTSEASTFYLTGIKRPLVDQFYQNKTYSSPFNLIAYFCNSAQIATNETWGNYINYPSSLTKSFIIDFNPPVTSPKAFTVTVTQDKSETIFKNDIAGNTKLAIALPAKIPGGLNIRFFANSNAYNANTICGVVTTTTQPVLECSQLNSSTLTCPTNKSDINYTICCYNVSIASDTFSLSSLYVSVPAAPNADQSTRFNTEKLYDAASQISTTPISWTTAQSAGTDVIGTQSAKISKVDYSQVIQDSGIGKVTFTVTLPREPTRNMALTLVGDFSGMLIQNNPPRCVVTFGNSLGANWDSSGDILIDACDVSNFSGSTAPILITTKNIVYKCGLSFASKSAIINLWPIIQVNWSNNPYSSNNYKVTMTLNNSSLDAIALNSATFNISSNLTYSAKPGFVGQWDTLCVVSSIVPKIPGEYADYQFDFDLDTNKGALTNVTPNEVSIFFPYSYYGASIQNVLCFYNNATMNCSFTDEGILNIRFTSTLPVGSGKKISIMISGIYNPSYESEIYFPCTVNNTNFSSGLRVNLITGSGKLTGGIPIPSTTTQGVLRFMNPLTVTDVNPRNVSTHTFRITFDSGIGLSNTPITISNTPQIIITFPQDYNLSWYTTVKATATIDEYTNDTSNNIIKTSSLNPASVSQTGNRITIILSNASYTFNTNWRYWDVKVSQITGPTDTTSGSGNNTTGPYSIILTNSNYSAIYRSFNNLNSSAYNTMNTQVDSWLQFNRGVEFKFDNTKWVIDINTSGLYNKLTVRPGRFILSTFTVKTNSSAFIQPRSASLSLNDQIFRLADTSYNIATGLYQPVTFYLGAPCGTAPGNYIIYFSLSGDNIATFFAPLAPVQIILDASTTGTASFSTPPSIPAGSSTLIYYTLSEPNVDSLSVSWVGSETTKNDPTASITSATIPSATIKDGRTTTIYNIYSVFSITNLQASNNQIFKPNTLNACYTWSSSLLTITISGTQAIIPNQYDFTSSFKYSNADTDSTLTIKNAIKFTFTPPYSPIYVYCALVCFNRDYPSDDVIKSTTNNINSDNLTRYYVSMFNTKSPTDIIFYELVRGQRYKLRCIISSTEGNTALRTSAAVSIDQLTTTNGTVSQFIPSPLTKTQCVQYYFTSDPGQATKIAMINYCQKLFSQSGWTTSGCIICTDSGLTYTSPGVSLPSNLTCINLTPKSRLRFLQTSATTTQPATSTPNATVLTPTTAGSAVIPSLVNQSNPITFSICPIQHPVCPSDVSGNKLYSDYFSQLIADTKTTSLFNTNLGIVNVPVNNTLTVNDNLAPDISKNFNVNILSLNANGLVQFQASYTSAIKCSWMISDTSNPPASGTAIDSCTDTQWCGKNFNVGTLQANTATNINNLKAFAAGKSYALYLACYNDVPYSTSISNVYSVPLSVPNTSSPGTTTPTTTPTNTTTPTGSQIYYVSVYVLLSMIAMLF